jgi:hypothetical protein
MAANETRGIAAPLLSRLSVHQIAPPPADAFAATLAGLIGAVAATLGCDAGELPALEPELRTALRQGFARHRNLRRLRAQLEDCLGSPPRRRWPAPIDAQPRPPRPRHGRR